MVAGLSREASTIRSRNSPSDQRDPVPVKLGDTISANVTPLEARPSKTAGRGVLKLGFEVLNQRDEVVQTGSIVLLMQRRPDNAKKT